MTHNNEPNTDTNLHDGSGSSVSTNDSLTDKSSSNELSTIGQRIRIKNQQKRQHLVNQQDKLIQQQRKQLSNDTNSPLNTNKVVLRSDSASIHLRDDNSPNHSELVEGTSKSIDNITSTTNDSKSNNSNNETNDFVEKYNFNKDLFGFRG